MPAASNLVLPDRAEFSFTATSILSSTRLPVLLVVAGVLLRLIWITAPFTNWHETRQCDTGAIARNFLEGPMNILYPRADWGGDTPGYLESEFPIYSFAVACLYQVFGAHDWLGRLLNVLLYAPSAWLLFLLVKRISDHTSAAFAVLFYTISPLSFVFTRNVQPDTLMCLASLAALFCFESWTLNGSKGSLLIAAASLSVAVLIKPISLYLGLPLLYICYRAWGWRLLLRLSTWLMVITAFVPAILWYYHAHGFWTKYGNSFAVSVGHKGSLGWFAVDTAASYIASRSWGFLIELVERLLDRLVYQIATIPGIVFLGVGVAASLSARKALLHWWVAGFGISILMLPGQHAYHNYYQLPIVFAVAAYMGFGAARLLQNRTLDEKRLTCLLILMLGCGAVVSLKGMRAPHTDRLRMAERVQALTPADALFVISKNRYEGPSPDPRDFYYCHRKGWSVSSMDMSPARLRDLQKRGAKYFATVHKADVFAENPALYQELTRFHTPLDIKDNWAIYKLEPVTPDGREAAGVAP